MGMEDTDAQTARTLGLSLAEGWQQSQFNLSHHPVPEPQSQVGTAVLFKWVCACVCGSLKLSVGKSRHAMLMPCDATLDLH